MAKSLRCRLGVPRTDRALRSHRDWRERKKRDSKHSDIDEKLGRS